MAINFPPPPTYALPVIEDPITKASTFNPIWLNWFLQITQILEENTNTIAAGGNHEELGGLLGGAPNDHVHLTQVEYDALIALLP